jgi:hypothetical protein
MLEVVRSQLMRPRQQNNEPLSSQTSIKLPYGAFLNEKGDSGNSRNPLYFSNGAEGGI